MLALYSFLFCGLLVNKSALDQMGARLEAQWGAGIGAAVAGLPYSSFMFRFIEMVLVDELATQPPPTVMIRSRTQIPGVARLDPVPVGGPYILDFLGYSHGGDSCGLGMPCAAWRDLGHLLLWLAAAQALCYVLLRFCVPDPH